MKIKQLNSCLFAILKLKNAKDQGYLYSADIAYSIRRLSAKPLRLAGDMKEIGVGWKAILKIKVYLMFY